MTAVQRPRRQILTTRDIVVLALFAALIALAKAVLRMPIHVPGHTGMTWMAILLVGRAFVRKPWAGTLMGFVSGVIAVAVVGGREGLLLWLKYLAPGAIMDLAAFASAEHLGNVLVASIAGATANAAKLITSLIISLALGIPADYLALGLGLTATTHIVFGALGGRLGAIVLAALRRIDSPVLRPYVQSGETPR